MSCLAGSASLGSGCADSVRVSKWRTAELVDQYSKDQDSVLLRGGRRYRLEPENRLELEVVDKYGNELSSARLEQVRTKGERLVFPDGMEVHPDQLEAARLVVNGEPLTRLEPHSDVPSGKRSMIGMQLGGTAFLQALVRVPVVHGLSFEAGLLPYTHALNGSAGFVYERPLVGNLSTYAGAGVGFGATVYASYIAFGHGRLGLGHRFKDRNLWLGVDAGVWVGVADAGIEDTTRYRFLVPMGGLALLHEY
jgi:hypothetical protein